MATNLEIIENALREINVISEIGSASDEQGAHGLRLLNEMLAEWQESKDFAVGWFDQGSTGDTFPLPRWTHRAIQSNLAIDMAPKYGASVSLELATKADDSYKALFRKVISESEDMDNKDMSHLPEGAGHYGTRYDITSDR